MIPPRVKVTYENVELKNIVRGDMVTILWKGRTTTYTGIVQFGTKEFTNTRILRLDNGVELSLENSDSNLFTFVSAIHPVVNIRPGIPTEPGIYTVTLASGQEVRYLLSKYNQWHVLDINEGVVLLERTLGNTISDALSFEWEIGPAPAKAAF